MVTNNNENFISWKWEATNNTASITAADSQTYLFGNYNDDIRISPPAPSQKLSEVWTHQYRNPLLLKGATQFPTWKHKFHPVNCMPEFMFLGAATDASPDTITVKHTGLKHSFSARWEYRGGTNPRRAQSVGNYAVGYMGHCGTDMPYLCELTNTWGKFETESDRVALTTDPIFPESIESSYSGLSEVKWDYGEAGEEEWQEVYEIEFTQLQKYTETKPSKTYQYIYPHSYGSVDITFFALLNQNQQWEDYVARETKDVAIKIPKGNDATKYKQIVFSDVQIESIIDTHIAYGEEVLAKINAKASKFEVNFTHEGDNFSTFFPAYA
jgi:hypothetical protein